MALQTCLIRPQFRETNEPGVERVFGHVVGDAAIVSIRLIDKLLEVRQNLFHPLWREAQDAKDGDCRIHFSLSVPPQALSLSCHPPSAQRVSAVSTAKITTPVTEISTRAANMRGMLSWYPDCKIW